MQSCPPGISTPVSFTLPLGVEPTNIRWRALDEGGSALQDWTPLGVQSPNVPTTTPGAAFSDPLDTLDTSRWMASDGVNGNPFLNSWVSQQVSASGGTLSLQLIGDPGMASGRSAASGEYSTTTTYGYGTYRFVAKASNTAGVINGLFTYTGPSEGTAHDEIDVEIKGDDTTKMQVNYWTNDVEHPTVIDLGFDASADYHEYAFSWSASAIQWFVDGALVHEETGTRGPLPSLPGKIFLNIWGTVGTMPWSTDYIPSLSPSTLSVNLVSFDPLVAAPSVPSGSATIPTPIPGVPMQVTQTIPATLTALIAPAQRGMRVIELEVTAAGEVTYMTLELLIQGTTALVPGANSFLTYGQAAMLSMDFAQAQIPGWVDSPRAEREGALMEAFRRIMQLPIGPQFIQDQDRITNVTVFGARTLRNMTPENILKLNAYMLGDLRMAQIVEADEILNPDLVIQGRYNGLQSTSAGESTQLFRYTMPLTLPVSPRAMAYLQRWVRFGGRIERA